ncbi:CRISPR-associated helicase Cas3' [Methanobacterium sp.]|uniref:CRISPR-associated helicase Cas3' n=1 Tax=Methanobacterium sp. TaxID=2164 RepID=UPI0025F2F11C|nr:CRISPR-associated helicase Cas3' [Methanobacterium sp.]MBI5460452.1 CRISPR-associated helicase Cas3' [Methanobacterium sp.]
MIFAKRQIKNEKEFFQTLEGHTIDSLRILKEYIRTNSEVVSQFCQRWDLSCELFLKNLFISIYLHDIGKLTKQFQDNISLGKSSQKYPHAYYSFFLLNNVDYNQLVEEVSLEKLAVLGHHTQLYNGIYSNDENFGKPKFSEKEIKSFIMDSCSVYHDMGFEKYFKFEGLQFNENDFKFSSSKARRLLNQTKRNVSKFNKNLSFKSIFTYFFSILQLCDDYSSANFSKFIETYEGTETLFGPVLDDPCEYVTELNVKDPLKTVFGDYEPYTFQKDLFEKSPKFSFLFAPCGRGKSEAAISWALNCMEKYNRNKIVFAMPTQVTSNAMWERLCTIFGEGSSKKEKKKNGKKYVGLFHGKSFIKLKSVLIGEKDDLDKKTFEELSGDTFKGNIFFKPITVTTIDHVIYSFVHGFRQADFALGNLQNAIIIFDEVHYYEEKTLNHLFTLFKLLREFEIPHLLMSGTLPDFIKKDADEYLEVVDFEGIEYMPFSFKFYNKELIKLPKSSNDVVETPEVCIDSESIEEIVSQYKKGLKQFIILNTVKRAQEFYKIVKMNLENEIDYPNVLLYHSQYTYNDRVKKESEIRDESENGPFILIATQVIEISLDISCDIMYTEVAPPDAIGQRGGRLNRKGKTFKNGVTHEMKIFLPEKHLPYDENLLKDTQEKIRNGPVSYKEIKEFCDNIYQNRELKKTNLTKIFRKCTLFGYKPIDIVFGDDKGRMLQIRDDKVQKIDVIPSLIYNNNDINLNVENQVKVPFWWYQNDQNECGEDLEFFEIVSRKFGKKEVFYVICKMDYTYDMGFDYGRKVKDTFEDYCS